MDRDKVDVEARDRWGSGGPKMSTTAVRLEPGAVASHFVPKKTSWQVKRSWKVVQRSYPRYLGDVRWIPFHSLAAKGFYSPQPQRLAPFLSFHHHPSTPSTSSGNQCVTSESSAYSLEYTPLPHD